MILWADSFDHYGDTESNMTDGPWAEIFADISTEHPRTGARGLRLGASGSAIARRVFGGNKTVAGVGMALYMPALPTVNGGMVPIQFMDDANAAQVRVVVESTGAISVYLGPFSFGNMPVATSTELATTNGQNHLEAKCACDASTGSVEVRLNGVTVCNVSGINTDMSGHGNIAQYASTNSFNRGADSQWFIDDVIAWDGSGTYNNDFVGDKKVFTDFPDADTADIDWTPSTGTSRFAMVDDPDPDGDGTYDEADDVNDVMGVTYPDVDPAVLTIAALIFLHKTKKTDAGTSNVQQSVISGSDQTDGDDRPMTTAYIVYQDVIETDPATSAPWMPAAASAAAQNLTRTA